MIPTDDGVQPGDKVTVVGMNGLGCARDADTLVNATGPTYFGFPYVPYRPIEELI